MTGGDAGISGPEESKAASEGSIVTGGGIAVGGLLSIYASDFLPEKIRPIGKIAGVGLIGYGAFIAFTSLRGLFSGVPGPSTGAFPPNVPEGEQIPQQPPGKLADLLLLSIDENQQQTGGSTWTTFVSHNLRFAIRNNTGKDVTLYYGAEALYSNSKKFWETPTNERQMITLKAGETKQIDAFVPDLVEYIWLPQTAIFRANVYTARDDSVPASSTKYIPIKVAILG